MSEHTVSSVTARIWWCCCRHPDAVLQFADRFAALDHHTGHLYIAQVHEATKAAQQAALQWLQHAVGCIVDMQSASSALPFEVQASAALQRKHRRHTAAAASGANAAEAGADMLRRCQHHRTTRSHRGAGPVAAWQAHALATAQPQEHRPGAQVWRRSGSDLQRTADALAVAHHCAASRVAERVGHRPHGASGNPQHRAEGSLVSKEHDCRAQFELQRSEQRYLQDIAACQDALHRGDSYEICLTNALHARMPQLDAWRFYQTLRRVNAAPHAAWLHCGKVHGWAACSLQ